ncbi:hypothetical protein C8A03DRAFT_45014 [Achaetomium macrosporum]|uniref:Uncharacterized protein n=1 Tax=Achaetomium macrosporum TaxID=79813 RepID=A0AAN7C8S9_9PEZI|nr:hypothetical protein C8A03DRAFT_45014 [Achaetomium macrosporum]
MRADEFPTQAAPAEVLVNILQCCDSTRDVLALVSTWRHICDVWRDNTAAALWPVWLKEIPHFQDVLAAARMTRLVVDAARKGELPPTRISPRQLQHSKQPNIPELKAAFALHRFTRAFCERVYYRQPESEAEWLQLGGYPEEPARMPEWTANVSRTVLKVLVIGAALAGAYNEALFQAMNHPDPEIGAFLKRARRGFDLPDGVEKQKVLEFLLPFAVCDLQASLEADDAVFGPLAEWLLHDIFADRESRASMEDRFKKGYGRAGYCRSRVGDCPVHLADGSGSHSDAHLVVWEVMKMLWVVEHIRPRGMAERWSYEVIDRSETYEWSPTAARREIETASESEGPLASAAAVFFGMFKAEEVMLPACLDDFYGWDVLKVRLALHSTEKECSGDETRPLQGFSVTDLFHWILTYSGRPKRIEEDRHVAPLDLKFFEYFLRRFLGLGFRPSWTSGQPIHYAYIFGPGGPNAASRYDIFASHMKIFSHDDIENRRSYHAKEPAAGDFLDGFEFLRKYSSD